MDINLSTNNFKIEGKVGSNHTSLIMKLPEYGHFTTKTLPLTQSILRKHLPSIFECQCFNEKGKCFHEESKNTELGHLFEHIMLEFLCIEKLDKGQNEATYEGRTDWEIDRQNVFYIEIKIGIKDTKIIKKAFNKSVNLFKKILN